jgi:hypothetical protein
MSLRRRALNSTISIALGLSALATAATVDPFYAGSYSLVNLGSAPGVPTPYGGLTFLNASPNTLLLGGAANANNGVIDQVGLTRGATGHVTPFTAASTSSQYSTAPNISGGLAYGPANVLFFTAYPTNNIGQIRPGSTTPDKTTTSGVASNVGGLQFVPTSFTGAGQMAVLSYNASTFSLFTLTPDGTGTFNYSLVPGSTVVLQGGPEGLIYVPAGSALFPTASILVAEFGFGDVASYTLDSNGLPVAASRKAFIRGLIGAEGAAVDPLTNDIFFSSFADNQVFEVNGFAAPVASTPEPTTFSLLGLAMGAGFLTRRRRAQTLRA